MHGLLIDHDDSFTANLSGWLSQKFSIDIVKHSDFDKILAQKKNWDFIVLSAGPKSPTDYSTSLSYLIRQRQIQLNQTTPVLGICLGMQMMVQVCDGKVIPYTPVQHGKISYLNFTADLSEITKKPMGVARYHSLECHPSADFHTKARSQNDHRTMWIEHESLPWLGWQFHPESFLTTQADLLLNYFVEWVSCKALK